MAPHQVNFFTAIIINLTFLSRRPHLKCTQFSKFKKQFEDQIEEAEANIGTAIAECDKVVAKHADICAERDELVRVLQSGDSAVQEIIDKTKRLEAASQDLRNQVNDTQKKIKAEEELRGSICQGGEKVTQEANALRSKISSLENECEKCEEDKTTKDNQIHSLREEVAHQEDMIVKLGEAIFCKDVFDACSIFRIPFRQGEEGNRREPTEDRGGYPVRGGQVQPSQQGEGKARAIPR